MERLTGADVNREDPLFQFLSKAGYHSIDNPVDGRLQMVKLLDPKSYYPHFYCRVPFNKMDEADVTSFYIHVNTRREKVPLISSSVREILEKELKFLQSQLEQDTILGDVKAQQLRVRLNELLLFGSADRINANSSLRRPPKQTFMERYRGFNPKHNKYKRGKKPNLREEY